MSKAEERQNIVIVGGGNGGLSTFNELSNALDASKYNLILVTPRPFFIHLPATIRMVVTANGKLEDSALMPLPEDRFNTGNKKLILGKVTSITDDETKGRHVILDNGAIIEYTVLVLAPGSLWNTPVDFPHTKEEIVQVCENWRSRFAEAKDVVLVGGGSIGVELAGGLKDLQSDKNVTIVQGQSLLLNDSYPASFRKRVANSVTARGVNLVLDDYVDDIEIKEGSIHTRNGKSIPADLVVPTRGPRPNTKFITSLGSDVLTSSGYVKVSPTLQLASHPRIFAAGDVIDWKEQKQSAKVAGHASVVANNVLVLLGQKKVMINYKGATEAILITNGKYGGIAYIDILWGIVLGNWLVSLIKSRGLLVGMLKSMLKL